MKACNPAGKSLSMEENDERRNTRKPVSFLRGTQNPSDNSLIKFFLQLITKVNNFTESRRTPFAGLLPSLITAAGYFSLRCLRLE